MALIVRPMGGDTLIRERRSAFRDTKSPNDSGLIVIVHTFLEDARWQIVEDWRNDCRFEAKRTVQFMAGSEWRVTKDGSLPPDSIPTAKGGCSFRMGEAGRFIDGDWTTRAKMDVVIPPGDRVVAYQRVYSFRDEVWFKVSADRTVGTGPQDVFTRKIWTTIPSNEYLFRSKEVTRDDYVEVPAIQARETKANFLELGSLHWDVERLLNTYFGLPDKAFR